jgi:undecaprenyl pyrophosphate phosphatase UppP
VTAPNSKHPSRRDRLRPFEYVVISAVIAVFIGLVVLLSTRELTLALVFVGIAFIVSLVVIAMLALAVKPDEAEKIDLTEQDHQSDNGH